jgi:hypothetical protein
MAFTIFRRGTGHEVSFLHLPFKVPPEGRGIQIEHAGETDSMGNIFFSGDKGKLTINSESALQMRPASRLCASGVNTQDRTAGFCYQLIGETGVQVAIQPRLRMDSENNKAIH